MFRYKCNSVVLIKLRYFTSSELEFDNDEPFGTDDFKSQNDSYNNEIGNENKNGILNNNNATAGKLVMEIDQEVKQSTTIINDRNITEKHVVEIEQDANNESTTSIKEPDKLKKEERGWKAYLGLILALLSAIFFSSCGLTTKILAMHKNHVFDITLWKYQGLTFVAPILLIYYRGIKKVPIFDCIWPLNNKSRGITLFFLFVRTTAGMCSVILGINAQKYLKLADATTIVMSTPIAVTLFARVFLKEPCGIVPIFTAFLTLSGVCILTRPPILTGEESFDINTLIGVSMAFSAMLFLTSVFLILRFLRTVHFSFFVSFYGIVGSIESLILGASFGILNLPKSQFDWAIAVASAITGALGQFAIIFALKFENASPVSLIRTSEIVFSFIWQFIFLGVSPDWLSLVGAGIVMSGLIITTLRKWLTTLPEDHVARQRYKFLLL